MNQPQPLLTTRPVDKTTFDHQGWCMQGRILDDRDLAAVRSEKVRFRAHPMEKYKDVPGSDMLIRRQVVP